jgi:glycosyltransferase involved in cell wall biosynthesis
MHSLPIRYLLSIIAIIRKSKSSDFIFNGLFVELSILSLFRRIQYVAKVPGDIVWERAKIQGETKLTLDLYQGSESTRKKIMRFLFVRTLKLAKCVIVPNEEMITLVSKWGVDPTRIVKISNSVKPIFFESSVDLDATKLYDVVVVGRLISVKGVSDIITMAKAANLSVAIAGSGPEENSLRDLCKQIGANVTFLGELQTPELIDALLLSRFFVMNSEHEGSPHALIEALALGMICFARLNSGTSELLNDINGFLFTDINTVAETIEYLSSEYQVRQRISLEARRFAAENFKQEVVFQKILGLV